jgi:predicted Rossmann fold flavoprotein
MIVKIIGGGAAGFFAAISVKTHHPNADVQILEKSNKLLAKVKVSGGGRCNVTHACFNNKDLVHFYPRGKKFLQNAFKIFTTTDTISWFKSRGVEIKTEEDNRMFPKTNSSQTIIDCLLNECKKLKINILLGQNVQNVQPLQQGLQLIVNQQNILADYVIIASGGSPNIQGLQWLKNMGHTIQNPVPSLFTFNIPNNNIVNLMGVVASKALVKIQGTNLQQTGAVLVTHWGFSGPAILKLSAWGARELADKNYNFIAAINWINISNENIVRELLEKCKNQNPKKKISNVNPFDLPNRLWMYLLEKSEIAPEVIYAEQGKKGLNKLVNFLLNDTYEVSGKTTFKEEFVTCGGIDLHSVNSETLESKVIPRMYFAGEILDIDGVTGGFNFQAAWTTGFIAGKLE